MGGKSTTVIDQTRTVTPSPPTQQELELLEQQTRIAESIAQNIDLTSGAFQQQLAAIQPLLDLAAEEARIRGEVLTPEVQTQIIQNEIALQEANVALLRSQLESEVALEPQRREFLENQIAAAEADLERIRGLEPLRDATLEQAFEILQSGGVPTAAQREFLDESTRRTIEAGRSDIQAFADEQIRLLREELAPSLGLRPGDTPIIDRGGLIAREAIRQFGQLESTTRGQEAGALAGLIGQNLSTAGGITGLELSLADAAQKNRIALAAALDPNTTPTTVGSVLGSPNSLINQTFGLGLGTSNIPTGIPSTLGNLLNFRAGTASQNVSGTSTTKKSLGFADILGGVGGLLTGIGNL